MPGGGASLNTTRPSATPLVSGGEEETTASNAEPKVDASHMKVLVAEDDPVNSRIIKKRLSTLAHEVFLTVNGEECASTYCEKTGFFDIVLMDMQVSFCVKYCPCSLS
jgi:PleD family two-component response regulator